MPTVRQAKPYTKQVYTDVEIWVRQLLPINVYTATQREPPKARISPNNTLVPLPISAIAINRVPKNAAIIPITPFTGIFSRYLQNRKIATKKTSRFTRTTEAAMLVYFNDSKYRVKCIPKKRPLQAQRKISFF